MIRVALALLLASFCSAVIAGPVLTDHVEAELIAENQWLQTGETDNWIALRLRPDPGWHVYWRNPGDSGIPTEMRWPDLPPGVEVGAMQWPYPHPHSLGDLTNYGYDAETLHLFPVQAAQPGALTLRGQARWLVCKDICIPGEADLELSIEARAAEPSADLAWAGAFAAARSQLPVPAPDWRVHHQAQGADFSLEIRNGSVPAGALLRFYPYANDLVNHAAVQRVARDSDSLVRLSQALSSYFVEAPSPLAGVLVVQAEGGPTRAYELNSTPAEVATVPDAALAPPAVASQLPADVDASLAVMLGFAFVGGLILNLMPCVFPVLAIKALSVLQARGGDRAGQRTHALAYTFGVVASFVVVAALLLGLRAGGAALGWGFQLQSPPFVYALVCVMFVVGLSLSGLVSFGSRWMGVGQQLAQSPGLAGSFFTGVLAVVVASPCTAPLMAPALGFALAQPAVIALAVFMALGLGLAAPFLLIGLVPTLATWLPRPGAWMETFKQVLAFPMYLTAVWLLWVLGGLTDRHGMALGLVGLVALAFALWWLRRAPGWFGRSASIALVASVAAMAARLDVGQDDASGAARADASRDMAWEAYSDARFEALRAQGRSVFVDFTADWCLTCKLNERGALRAATVRKLFAEQDVALLVGDWTRPDPAITAVLQRYGRSGVPLYLASHRGAAPQVLPQVLTPQIIGSAFAAAEDPS